MDKKNIWALLSVVSLKSYVWNKLKMKSMTWDIFFENGTRRGVSYVCNRYSEANNKYLNSYDPKQESKHLYLDPNNSYGYPISKFLATSRFKWVWLE